MGPLHATSSPASHPSLLFILRTLVSYSFWLRCISRCLHTINESVFTYTIRTSFPISILSCWPNTFFAVSRMNLFPRILRGEITEITFVLSFLCCFPIFLLLAGVDEEEVGRPPYPTLPKVKQFATPIPNLKVSLKLPV